MSIEWNSTESKKRLVQYQHQQPESNKGRRSKRVIGQPVESFSSDLSIDKRIKLASSIGSSLPPSHQRLFLQLLRDDDKVLIADFIIDSYNQKNIALNTKVAYVTTLVHLSRYLGHKKSFMEMTSQDVVEGRSNHVITSYSFVFRIRFKL